MSAWTVYILRCADDSLYTGIALDVTRRLHEHNKNNKSGASYTRGRRPVCLVYQEVVDGRGLALRREHQIKQLSRREKEELIRSSESFKLETTPPSPATSRNR